MSISREEQIQELFAPKKRNTAAAAAAKRLMVTVAKREKKLEDELADIHADWNELAMYLQSLCPHKREWLELIERYEEGSYLNHAVTHYSVKCKYCGKHEQLNTETHNWR